MQHEITERIPLLDERGNLTQPGLVPGGSCPFTTGRRSGAEPPGSRNGITIYVGNDRCGVALTIADNSYMGLDSISFLSFEEEPWQVTKSPMRHLAPWAAPACPPTPARGSPPSPGKGYALMFRVELGRRVLTAHMDRFLDGQPIDVCLTLTGEPEESMVICTPFEKDGAFLLQPEDQLYAGGRERSPSAPAAGPSPRRTPSVCWTGAGACGRTTTRGTGAPPRGWPDGVPFGFNIGYGFGRHLRRHGEYALL